MNFANTLTSPSATRTRVKSVIAWSMDTKAGKIESACINDLIATQCAHALKMKAYLAQPTATP